MLLNYGVGEDSWESLGLQGDQTSQSFRKSVLNIPWRTDAEAEAPVLWPPDAKNWLIRKNPDAGKDWRQEAKGMTEDEMVGWHEFEQALGVADGQGSLVCCSPWGHKELDTTEQLNWTDQDKEQWRDFAGGLHAPHERTLCSIPDQGTISHMAKIRSCVPQLRSSAAK